MKFGFLTIVSFMLSKTLFGQVEFYSGGLNGDFCKGQTNTCEFHNKGYFESFLDIAITPNGTLYGIAGGFLYRVDLQNQTSSVVNSTVHGVGLVALNDDLLLTELGTDLYSISTANGDTMFVDTMGYDCNGDFAFFNEDLYLVTGGNHLVKMGFDTTSISITSWMDVGLLNTSDYDIYGLFTSYESCTSTVKSLYAIESNRLYKVDASNANVTLVCTFGGDHYSGGAASLFDFDITASQAPAIIPNVFTPNLDGINDTMLFINPPPQIVSDFEFQVYNRWGVKLFETTDPDFRWDGRDFLGNELSDGVYFYVTRFESACFGDRNESGFITIMK